MSSNINCAKFYKNISHVVQNPTNTVLLNNYIDFEHFVNNPNIENITKELNLNLIEFYENLVAENEYYSYRFLWKKISKKCKKLDFLIHYKHKLQWKELSENEIAIDLIIERWNTVESKVNNLPTSVCLDWDALSLNKSAIPLLEQNIDKINWQDLSFNENAIPLLEKNINKIDWIILALNKNAIGLLEKYIKNKKNLSKSFWNNLSTNPNIFILF